MYVCKCIHIHRLWFRKPSPLDSLGWFLAFHPIKSDKIPTQVFLTLDQAKTLATLDLASKFGNRLYLIAPHWGVTMGNLHYHWDEFGICLKPSSLDSLRRILSRSFEQFEIVRSNRSQNHFLSTWGNDDTWDLCKNMRLMQEHVQECPRCTLDITGYVHCLSLEAASIGPWKSPTHWIRNLKTTRGFTAGFLGTCPAGFPVHSSYFYDSSLTHMLQARNDWPPDQSWQSCY